ncbi:MAG: GNAT family N-acetyltransferase [Beijerinckiaceae bacterium]|nr:GNAT family N-acetyltransferase [Beijerinckiaceae bacterium]
MTMIDIRPLSQADVSAVGGIQRLLYRADLIEDLDSFQHKIDLFPRGCLGAFKGNELRAYVFSHPWKLGAPAPLNNADYRLPEGPDCYYIHDLAVHPDNRSEGIANAFIEALCTVAYREGLNTFSLTAVQDSEAYWARWGFAETGKLIYGGAEGVSMTCPANPLWR